MEDTTFDPSTQADVRPKREQPTFEVRAIRLLEAIQHRLPILAPVCFWAIRRILASIVRQQRRRHGISPKGRR